MQRLIDRVQIARRDHGGRLDIIACAGSVRRWWIRAKPSGSSPIGGWFSDDVRETGRPVLDRSRFGRRWTFEGFVRAIQ
jgi:hypothetical protein